MPKTRPSSLHRSPVREVAFSEQAPAPQKLSGDRQNAARTVQTQQRSRKVCAKRRSWLHLGSDQGATWCSRFPLGGQPPRPRTVAEKSLPHSRSKSGSRRRAAYRVWTAASSNLSGSVPRVLGRGNK